MAIPLPPERAEALVSLIDDESPTVQQALLAEFQRLGPPGLDLLRRLAEDASPSKAEAARRFLESVDGPDPAAEFIRFIRSFNYELETGCLLLNRVINPDLDTGGVMNQLDAIARRCRELCAPPISPWEKCKIINRVLFHEYGFRGNVEDYEDPANSFIGPVIRRRRGLPISLSILYLLVADRIGLDLEPISLPGRFMVGCFKEGNAFYIDVFERGRFLTPDELQDFLLQNHVYQSEPYLSPAPVSEVLCRCCRNLVHHYAVKNDTRHAKLFASFVREFEESYRRSAQA